MYDQPEFWTRLLGIVLIDLALAGDNALVIALAVRDLPPRAQWLGRLWGTAGAVALRVVFIAAISRLLTIPLLQAAGGALLLWIAVRLVRTEKKDEGGDVPRGASLREAIWIVVAADVTMSLDNVLAVAAAAHGDLWLVVAGIALSLPLVVWGSGLLARLMIRFRWIIWLGAGVLGYVAGEMMLDDPLVRRWAGDALEVLDAPVQMALAAALTLLGWRLAQRPGGRDDATAGR